MTAWWELDQLGGGVLVGLYPDGSVVVIEGDEPHPGYRRVATTTRLASAELLATSRWASSDATFVDAVVNDLRARR